MFGKQLFRTMTFVEGNIGSRIMDVIIIYIERLERGFHESIY